MKHPIMVAALVVGGLGCLFVLIGLATPSWATADNGNGGLFVFCNQYGCASYTAIGALQAVKAFIIIAFFCSLVGLIDGIYYFVRFLQKDVQNRTLPLVSGIFYIVAGALALLGCIIFSAADLKGEGTTLGYSFALTIIGGILCGVAGGLTVYHRQTQTS